MLNLSKEIPKRLKELGGLFTFREIVVKDVNELEEINDCFKGQCDEWITKNSHLYARKYGDPIFICGIKFSHQTLEEIQEENLKLKEQSAQDVSTIRTLLRELYKQDYTPKQIRELMGR